MKERTWETIKRLTAERDAALKDAAIWKAGIEASAQNTIAVAEQRDAARAEAAQKQLFLEIVSENADIIANQRDAARAALTTLVEALGECEAVRMAAGHVYTNPTNPNYCRCHRRALPCPVAVAREKLDKGI